jgi:6-phosphogluconate dehydrogenase
MGVSGCGKSTIGKLLAENLSIPFFDADDYHSKENIAKMASGKPLNNEDRAGWLSSLNQLAKEQLKQKGAIIACSALKENYRNILNNDIETSTKWVYLAGDFKEIKARIEQRENHYMAAGLLQSQFDILEEPKEAIKININLSPEEILEHLKTQLS